MKHFTIPLKHCTYLKRTSKKKTKNTTTYLCKYGGLNRFHQQHKNNKQFIQNEKKNKIK